MNSRTKPKQFFVIHGKPVIIHTIIAIKKMMILIFTTQGLQKAVVGVEY